MALSIDQLEPSVREFFQRQFNLYDKDQSGTIPTEMLADCLRMCGQVPLEAEIPKLQKDADLEGKGVVTFDDFWKALQLCLLEARTQHDLKEAFRTFDPDERSTISQHEMRYILTTMGDKLTDEEMNLFIEEMKTEVDTEGNLVYLDVIQKLLPEYMR